MNNSRRSKLLRGCDAIAVDPGNRDFVPSPS